MTDSIRFGHTLQREEKNFGCPHGATVLILLLTVQSCAHLTSSELALIISNKLSPASAPKKGPSSKRDTMFRKSFFSSPSESGYIAFNTIISPAYTVYHTVRSDDRLTVDEGQQVQ